MQVNRVGRMAVRVLAVLLMLGCGKAMAEVSLMTYDGTTIEGGFNVSNGLIHYWNASGGYHVLDTATGQIASHGTPASYNSNYAGDPFGLYDAATQTFYAATYDSGSDSYVYQYDTTNGQWQDSGSAVNIYGGAIHQSQLYISGLREPWSGGFDSTFISLYDFSENHAHDALIEVGGASANLAVDSAGNIYYAAYADYGVGGALYRWDAATVQTAINHNLAGGEEDTFLTLDDGVLLSTLPAGGNGIVVDSTGAVFFTVNQFGNPDASGILRWDASMGTGEGENYEVVLSATELGTGDFYWFGPLAIEGSYDAGATLYTSLNFNGPIVGVTATPEPATMVLLAAGAIPLLRRKRKHA